MRQQLIEASTISMELTLAEATNQATNHELKLTSNISQAEPRQTDGQEDRQVNRQEDRQ